MYPKHLTIKHLSGKEIANIIAKLKVKLHDVKNLSTYEKAEHLVNYQFVEWCLDAYSETDILEYSDKGKIINVC